MMEPVVILLWVSGGVVFLVLVGLGLRVNDLRSRLDALPKDEAEIISMMQRIDADSEELAKWSNNADARIRRLEELMPDTLTQSSVVRYDAFPDLRGRLSRGVAVLDDAGNGFVLTVMVNRDESRFFLKGVTNGVGDEPLSPEEKSAVEAAGRG